MRAPMLDWVRRRRAAPLAVSAELRFLADTSERPQTFGSDPSRNRLPLIKHRVEIANARRAAVSPSLDAEGFALIEAPTEVRDFSDVETYHDFYLAELEARIAALVGQAAYAMPILALRESRVDGRPRRANVPETVHCIHVDYSERSAPAAAAAAMRRHGRKPAPGCKITAFNVWRATSPPPQDVPLAVCDRRSLAPQDMVRADAYDSPAAISDHVEYQLVRFNSAQRWAYFPDMNRDELLVFKQFESGLARPSGCPHSAFADPACPSNAFPRSSIDGRVFVVEESVPL